MKRMGKITFLLALFAGAGAVFAQSPQEARFLEITGLVEVQEAGSTAWKPASKGLVIGKSTVISAGIKSGAVIALGASRITVQQLTMLTLEELTQRDGVEAVELYLQTGRVRADVTPPTGLRSDFSVRSPTTTASVRGTSFEFDGNHVQTESGIVRFQGSNGQAVNVGAGQQSYSDGSSLQQMITPFEAQAAQVQPPALRELTASTGGNGGSASAPPQRNFQITITID